MEKARLPGGCGPWFEGWYWKHQGENGGLAVIPAAHRARRGEWTASLQILTPEKSWMAVYPIESYDRWPEPFQLRLGRSWFSLEGLWLDVEEPGLSLKGELRYGPMTVPDRDIMGPFARLPYMQCVHGLVSMGHSVDGSVCLNGRELVFVDGIGYGESDRGRSFPRRYLWTQCAWRERQRVSLMLAVARVPLGPVSFTGCICQIRWAGRDLRLATYDGAIVKCWSGEGAEVRQGKVRLSVQMLAHHSLPLAAPNGGRMSRTIHESLFSTVRYRLWEGETLVFDHTDECASFEFSQES